MPQTNDHPQPDLVSIIIPVRDGVPVVGEAIASALAQDHPAVEVLVVDDASTDGTADWVTARFGEKIRLLRLTTRHHLAATRNIGIAEARGAFLQFLDADDALPPSKIRLQLAHFAASPSTAVAVASTYEDGHVGPSRARHLPDLSNTALRTALLRGNFLGVHAALCRTDAVRSVGGFRSTLRRCEDYDLWLRLADAGAVFAIAPEVSVVYRRSPGSLSSDRRAQILANWQVLSEAVRRRPLHGWAERAAYLLHRISLLVRLALTFRP